MGKTITFYAEKGFKTSYWTTQTKKPWEKCNKCKYTYQRPPDFRRSFLHLVEVGGSSFWKTGGLYNKQGTCPLEQKPNELFFLLLLDHFIFSYLGTLGLNI